MEKKEMAVRILRVLGRSAPMLTSQIWMKVNGEQERERIHQRVVRRMLEIEMESRGHVVRSGTPARWQATPQGLEWLRRNDRKRRTA